MHELQPATRAYISILLGFAVALTVVTFTRAPELSLPVLLAACVAAICTAAAWLFPIQFAPRTKLYVDTAVTVAAVLLLPPGLAAVAVGTGTLVAHSVRGDTRDLPQALFNTAQATLVTLAAGLILALAGWNPVRPSFDNPRYLLIVPFVAIVMYLLNVFFVSVVAALELQRPVGRSVIAALVDDFRVEATAHTSLVAVGLLAAMVAGAYTWGVALLAIPVIATHKTLQHQARSRQQAERARLMSDEGLAEAQRLARVGSWEWRPATDQWVWSDEVYRLLGLAPGMAPASRDALLDYLSPADRDRVECALRAAHSDLQPFELEHRLRLPDGTERVLHQRAERRGNGYPLTFLGTIQDVTERVVAEETMRLAKDAAQEADRAKTQLLSMASHDLRTPLTAIQGFLEIVVDGSAGNLNEEQREFLEIAHRNTLQLAALVNDLLDLARIEAGRLNLRRQPVDAHLAVAQTFVDLTPQASAKGIQLKIAPRNGPAIANVDPARFGQMLQNLIGNAIKFTEKGDVTVIAAPVGEWVEIAVTDTGIGISPDAMPHIFEEFSQGGVEARRRGGAGLGLTIVKQLVALHGGTVSVQSTLDLGSTFTLRLPASAPSTTEIHRAAVKSPPALTPDEEPAMDRARQS